ncbi:DUF5677 domain-containing protein [Flagellimonas amoyensis]|uniref:DUF5677 domain-containing protein n=1 Tax=Flagellimonas amoyensis TaxID=2169401 RepID=UPI000D3BB28D|nr:DUF5677 domain-containing protein [Allomuricauda amoyensis]
MKFENEKIYGSTANINANLRKIILALNEDVSKLLLKQGEDYQLFALRALTIYAGKVFDRLISYQDFPIEYNAIAARNLFECYLIITYIISNPSKTKEFLSQKAYDELQINEGFLSITTANTSETTIKSIQDRMEYIKELMEKNKLTPSKSWNVSDLAKKTNNETEYKAFFKLYSKYVHPSSWIVNSRDNEYNNPVFKNIFILQGQHYASCITKLVSKYLDERNIA